MNPPVDPSHIVAFALVAAVLVAAPGPDWAFTLGVVSRAESLTAAVLGLVTGYLAMTLIVAGGIGSVMSNSASFMAGLRLAGAAYLAWLGFRSLFQRQRTESATDAAEPPPGPSHENLWSTWLTGVGVSALNPKALLLFLALLPQFTDRDGGWTSSIQWLTLGTTFTLIVAIFYPILGTSARTALIRWPSAASVLERLAGIAMLALAATLAAEQLIGRT